jgi:hypothetical protein
MNEIHWCEDKDTLVDYLYGELDADGRRVFEGHLRTCVACAMEIEGLKSVRTELADWLPPETELGFTAPVKHAIGNNGRPSGATVLQPPRWALSTMPVWARAAAAVFIIGAGAGLANVQVRYGADGLNLSTGWMSSPARSAAGDTARSATGNTAPIAASAASRAVESASTGASATAAWRPDLAALEADLRKELEAIRASAEPIAASRVTSSDDQALLRRVQALIEDSEKRQQKELALRISQFSRESEMQRRADFVRLEQGFRGVEAQRGATAVRQQQMLDYLYRVSTSKVP